jgi:hypothetical protein
MNLTEQDKHYVSHIKAVLECSSLNVSKIKNVFMIEDGSTDFDMSSLYSLRQALADDLLNGTSSHKYRISPFSFYLTDIIKMIYSHQTSYEFIIHFFKLFYQGKIDRQYQTVIDNALNDNNLAVCLAILKLPVNHEDKFESIHLIFEKLLLNFIHQEEEIHQTFIEHMRINFKADDISLIHEYKRLFKTHNVSLFLEALKKEQSAPLFPTHSYSNLSVCILDKKHLITHIDTYWINGISRRIEEKMIDFPQFYMIREKSDHFLMGVEQSEDKALEKFQTLVYYLIEQQYDYTKDHHESYATFLSIVEKVKLEFSMEKNSFQDKNNGLKI